MVAFIFDKFVCADPAILLKVNFIFSFACERYITKILQNITLVDHITKEYSYLNLVSTAQKLLLSVTYLHLTPFEIINRSRYRRCSVNKGVLKNNAKFTRQKLRWILFLIKLQLNINLAT